MQEPIQSIIKRLQISQNNVNRFSFAMLDWYEENGRSFPWRDITDPYVILTAEMLLQRTHAEQVAETFPYFIKKYPTVKRLAEAPVEDIKSVIGVLGISYRAARLKALAQIVLDKFGGRIPEDREDLLSLPGIGMYATNAVLCFAFGYRVPIVDSTVVRIFERVFGFHSRRKKLANDKELWLLGEKLMPDKRYRDYNYALLDFGALVCTAINPRHGECPITDICLYYLETVKHGEPSL